MASSGQKRAAIDQMAREHFDAQHAAGARGPSASSSSKKPRFDARNPSTLAADAGDADADADAILELDEIGKGGAQAKRNAVRIEGYESDSSEENFDARAHAKAQAEARRAKAPPTSRDEEENDMFADLQAEDGDEDEELAAEGKKRKKEVAFMDAGEIEGQVTSSKSGGHVSAELKLGGKGRARRQGDDGASASDSDESGDDEERDRVDDQVDAELGAGAKKRHAPKVDAFNMRDEAEEGRFDASGNFIRNAADPYAKHDSWLEGISKADMRKAREAQEKQAATRRARDMADDAVETSELLGALIRLCKKDETPLEATQRIWKLVKSKPGPKAKSKPGRYTKKKANGSEAMDVDEPKAAVDDQDAQRQADIDAISDAATKLMKRGQDDIMNEQRAMLIRQFRQETGEEWADERSAKQYEFRWEGSEDVYGPYDGEKMQGWADEGFFARQAADFRVVGDGEEWTRVMDFDE